METAAQIVVSGLVQGVGYRYFIAQACEALGLKGYVRNLPDGMVEIEVRGERSLIDELIGRAKTGPRHSRVREARVTWKPSHQLFDSFEIR